MEFICLLCFITIFAYNNFLSASDNQEKEFPTAFLVRQNEFEVQQVGGKKYYINLNIYKEDEREFLSFNEIMQKYFELVGDVKFHPDNYMVSNGVNILYATNTHKILFLHHDSKRLFILTKFFNNTNEIEE